MKRTRLRDIAARLNRLAKQQSAIASDLRLALAPAEGVEWADALIGRARQLAADLEAATIEVDRGRKDFGDSIEGQMTLFDRPPGPGPAAPPKADPSPRPPRPGRPAPGRPIPPGSDWRACEVALVVTSGALLGRLPMLRDSFVFKDGFSILTAGDLWHAFESGLLLDRFGWTVAEIKSIERDLCTLRAEAGDLPPEIAPIPDRPAKPGRKPRSKARKGVAHAGA